MCGWVCGWVEGLGVWLGGEAGCGWVGLVRLGVWLGGGVGCVVGW